MNTDHIKYQSLSAVEALDMDRTVEQRVQTAHDMAMKAGYDSGVDYAINHIIQVDAGSTDCRVSVCKNYHDGSQGNCREGLIDECGSYEPERTGKNVDHECKCCGRELNTGHWQSADYGNGDCKECVSDFREMDFDMEKFKKSLDKRVVKISTQMRPQND